MFIKRPVSIAGDNDERVTLSCLVDSNPAPTYSWYRTMGKGQKPRLVGNSANLSLIVSKDSVGEYICNAETAVDKDSKDRNVISASAKVYMKSKPRIFSDHRVQFATLDTIGRVVCEAISVPTVETVEWFYSGGLPVLTGNGGKFSVLENRSNDGVRSTLVIAGVKDGDLGQYTCRVTNSLGTDSAIITLQQQCKYLLRSGFPPLVGRTINFRPEIRSKWAKNGLPSGLNNRREIAILSYSNSKPTSSQKRAWDRLLMN